MLRRRTQATSDEIAAAAHPWQKQEVAELVQTRSSGQRASTVQLRVPPEKCRSVPVTLSIVLPRLPSGSKPEIAPVWIMILALPFVTLIEPRAEKDVYSLHSGSLSQAAEQLPSSALM